MKKLEVLQMESLQGGKAKPKCDDWGILVLLQEYLH